MGQKQDPLQLGEAWASPVSLESPWRCGSGCSQLWVRGMHELRVAVPAAWYLALCTRAAYDSGLEYETSPSLPVTQGYSFSLLQGQP